MNFRKITSAFVMITAIALNVHPLRAQDNQQHKVIKTDGTILSGKVLSVQPSTIEFDPAGDIPFIIVRRSEVKAIVYPDGTTVSFNDEPQANTPGASSPSMASANTPAQAPAGQLTCETFSTSNSGIPDNAIVSVAVDRMGRKYCGSFKGLSRFENTIWNKLDAQSVSFRHVSSIRSGSDNSIYFICDDSTLVRMNDTKTECLFQQELKDKGLNCLAIDRNNRLYLGTNSGVYMVNPDTLKLEKLNLPGDVTTALCIDQMGSLWLGTDGKGLIYYNGSSYKTFNTDNSKLPCNFIKAITSDNTGRIWIGTDGGGLAMFDLKNWEVYNSANSGIPSNFVSTLACNSQNQLWIGTDGAGAAFFDGQSWHKVNTKNTKLPCDIISSMAIDTDNSVWLGTFQGLAHVNFK